MQRGNNALPACSDFYPLIDKYGWAIAVKVPGCMAGDAAWPSNTTAAHLLSHSDSDSDGDGDRQTGLEVKIRRCWHWALHLLCG
jgi:hypothetical protein